MLELPEPTNTEGFPRRDGISAEGPCGQEHEEVGCVEKEVWERRKKPFCGRKEWKRKMKKIRRASKEQLGNSEGRNLPVSS